MSEKIRVRLRTSNREIEIEGPRTDVDELLDQWWAPSAIDDEPEEAEQEPKTSNRPAKARKRARPAKASGGETAPAFDHVAAANQIKRNQRFSAFERKVLHATNRLNKVMLVCWCLDKPLTSGEIHRTLTALKVGLSIQNVSTVLGNNSNKFILHAGRFPRYELRGDAKAEFTRWIEAKESAEAKETVDAD